MDLESIKKMNRDALASAKASAKATGSVSVPSTRASAGVEASGSVNVDVDQQHLIALLVAAAVGLVAYLVLRNYKPAFVTRQVGDAVEFDQTRGIISAVIAALVVMLAYYLYTKQ